MVVGNKIFAFLLLLRHFIFYRQRESGWLSRLQLITVEDEE